MKVLQMFALAVLAGYAAALVVENEIIKPEDIYDFVTEDSAEDWMSVNTKKYYCTYRNLWTKIDHAKDYPKFARLSNVIMYSSTTGFLPWLKTRQTTLGVETLAEAGYDGKFMDELKRAGGQILHNVSGDGYTINQDRWEENYVHLPPITVTNRYRYLNAICALLPSPDWFTGFYLFDTVDEYDRTFWNSFRLHIYPWDAGTDNGDTYTAFDNDAVPADIVRRFTKQTAPGGGIFLSAEGTIKPVGELECKLQVCLPEDEVCEKSDWPPVNGCDTFRFPRCDQQCDPATTTICEECKPMDQDQGNAVFHTSCCQSRREPKQGSCVNNSDFGEGNGKSGAAAVTGVTVGFAAIVGLLGFIL